MLLFFYICQKYSFMQLFDKVYSNVFLCEVYLGFNTTLSPSIIDGWQPFFNSLFSGTWQKMPAQISSINFEESSKETSAGTKYEQKVVFTFNNGDNLPSDRVAIFEKLKHVTLKLTDKRIIVIGRNDYNQNALPVVRVKRQASRVAVEVACESIFPIGFIPTNTQGLPVLIPINLNP